MILTEWNYRGPYWLKGEHMKSREPDITNHLEKQNLKIAFIPIVCSAPYKAGLVLRSFFHITDNIINRFFAEQFFTLQGWMIESLSGNAQRYRFKLFSTFFEAFVVM